MQSTYVGVRGGTVYHRNGSTSIIKRVNNHHWFSDVEASLESLLNKLYISQILLYTLCQKGCTESTSMAVDSNLY
jgi:hypothetical protein